MFLTYSIMNFDEKLNYFNINYIQIKKDIKKAVIEKKITSGSGGSSNIIIIRDNYVIKIIPNYKNYLLKVKPNHDTLEYNIYKKLTDEYLMTNKTPHIVGTYKKYILEDVKIMFHHKCLTLDQKIMLPFNKRESLLEKLCDWKQSYNNKTLEKEGTLIILENCPTTISDQLQNLLGMKQKIGEKVHNFNIFIKRILFQFMITLGKIHQDYPNFIHNDMFLRNILAVNETSFEVSDYIEYNHMGKKYYLPANGICIKINDFGYSLNILKTNSTLENEINQLSNSVFEIKNQLRDVYTFLFDLYDGPGMGGLSVKTIISQQIKNISNQNILLKNFRKQIGMFFNYKIIDKIHKLNLGTLDYLWNISDSKILLNTIKKPNDYFKTKAFDNLRILPDNCRVVKIYGIN